MLASSRACFGIVGPQLSCLGNPLGGVLQILFGEQL